MKKAIRIATCLVLVAGACGIPRANAQKQAPPEGGPPKAFTVPANETYALPNGLKVTLVPYGIVPKAQLSVAVDAGGLNEGSNRIGLSDLTAELMKEGTVTLTAEQVAEEAARMGSTLEVSAGADQTTLGLDVLQEFAPEDRHAAADCRGRSASADHCLNALPQDSVRRSSLRSRAAQRNGR